MKPESMKTHRANLNPNSVSKPESSQTASAIGTYPAPLAIVGIGCRLPGGVESWQDYWRLLSEGRDAIEETPRERWNLQKFYAPRAAPGKTQSKWGGYVCDIEHFDPQLFGISPREASSMDPQQRMLLEVAWRALEDAGQPIASLAGQPVSVFVGISSFDYAVAGLSSADRGVIDAYSNTGGSSSIAANRISYCFDLRGPSVAVDTACSSSLVAVHMACESIWNGDCTLALAGGVNALLLPDFYVAFSQLGVLSPDGRCKTFDARANGYVRSEGAGMVLLKPLADAQRDGDLVYAVIRSTALNQDGRTPGLTVPSQAAQEALVRTACRRAGIKPSEIQYIEAHGTGTPVGDPIEAQALANVLGENRPKNQPCWIGSVKTNIGHLEAGAGISSIIKVALSLYHQCIPAHLHFQQANPAIDFDTLGLRVPTETQPWHRPTQGTRLAGVNGFGYGGANAHVILEESPTDQKHVVAPDFKNHTIPLTRDQENDAQLPVVLPFSARSQVALQRLAGDWANWLEAICGDVCNAEIAAYAAHRRSHLDFRATVSGTSRTELIQQLRQFERNPSVAANLASNEPKIAFVCSGQGPQWWAMGRNLIRYCPAFREVIESCGKEFSKYGNWSLIEELMRSEATSRMQQTHIAQPSIFALQVGLAAVWKSWGITADFVVGHSVGEIAAAYISGALTFEDACAVALQRGRTMELATSRGAMIAVGLSASEIQPWMADFKSQVALAAVNSPTSITISGAADAIGQLADRLDAAGIFCRRLKVEYAFHSSQMEPVRDDLLHALSRLMPQCTHTELISTVTGKVVEGRELDANYWWQNVRQSVLFADAVQQLADRDCQIVLELGPHPVLAYSIAECFQSQGRSVQSLPSLHREMDDLRCMVNSLGELYKLGAKVLWHGFYARPTRKLLIPEYPFQRVRCWSESLQTRLGRLNSVDHPLLGESQHGPLPHWQVRIDLKQQNYLNDHRVRGACVYPAAAVIESALAAAQLIHKSPVVQLNRLRLHNPCLLAEGRAQWIETIYNPDRRQLEMQYRSADDDQWNSLATASVSTMASGAEEVEATKSSNIQLRNLPQTFDGTRLYSYCKRLGLEYGPMFQGVSSGSRADGQATAHVQLAPSLGPSEDGFSVHPALLDACFHAMIAADFDFDHTLGGLYLPAEIHRIRLLRSVQDTATVTIQLIRKTERRMVADIEIFDAHGKLCVVLEGFESQRVQGGGKPAETTSDLLYRYQWIPKELSKSPTVKQGRWLIFCDTGNVGTELASSLLDIGEDVVQVVRGKSFQQIDNSHFTLNPEVKSEFVELLRRCSSPTTQPIARIVYLWGLDVPPSAALTSEQLDTSTQLTTLAPLYLVQAWESLAELTQAELAIVTCMAQSRERIIEPVAVAQCPLLGMGRVVASECTRFRTKLIDLQSASCGQDLIAELLAAGTDAEIEEEDEVMWRDGQRFAHRFVKANGLPLPPDVKTSSQLTVGDLAGVEELKYCSLGAAALEPNQVEVEVLATGLNFSDVMKALELYPGLPEGPVPLGAECSGRVRRVGSSVTQWKIGDEIIAVAQGAFATTVVVSADLIARKPRNLTHEQAAAIPIAFLTADYALHDCAHISAGESVLIHAASGGVGLAAMQVAQLAGATIYATAGNAEKRSYVKQLGARLAMDSRSLAFADEILADTRGNDLPGVDVVLNSLPGEAISKGISILKTGGRFLEIGKRDIYSDAALGLYPFRNNLAFFAIDLDQLFKQQPARMGRKLAALVDRFESGELLPLHTKAFEAEDTRTAFRFMQQAKHFGKVVVRYSTPPPEIYPGLFEPIKFRSDETYWVVGGMGGFGMQVAKWLACHGAGNIAISGRRALTTAQSHALQDEFATYGTNLKLLRTDIANVDSAQQSLETIDNSLPPLRGVFHSAMVLEDRLLVDLDRTTLENVLRPKVLGGWNLHQLTQKHELRHFVLFSSLSSVFGHAGQANYSAANAMLDGLAHYRRSIGLPALVMNWGYLGEVGYLAEREQLGRRLERQGVLSFSVKQAMECLEHALQLNEIQLSVLRMDWSIWRGLGLTTRVSPRFAHLLHRHVKDEQTTDQLASAVQLRRAEPAARMQMIERLLRHKSGSLLGIAGEHILRERALLEMGLDSLMAVELRNWLESQLEISLPISALMRSSSFGELVTTICEIVAGSPEASSDVARSNGTEQSGGISQVDNELTRQQASELLDQLSSLGDQEVSQLLARMLRSQDN